MKKILTLTIMCVFAFAHNNLNAQCATTINSGVCYNSADGLQQIAVDICPDTPTEIVSITFTAGSIETCCDEVVVYSGAAGTGTGGTELHNVSQASGDLTGLAIAGTVAGECLHVYINADGSVDCTTEGSVAPVIDVTCAGAPPAAPSGGETCGDIAPLCSGSPLVFDGTGGAIDVGTAEPGIDLGCLGSGPRPSWFYVEVETGGNFDLNLDPAPAASVDYDFALYGPFADLATAQGACGAGLGAPIDCSFAGGTGSETPSIVGAVVGEIYVLLVSKFGATAAEFQLSEAGTTTGTTNCFIVSCPITQDFTTPASVCAGEAVNFTSGGACAGINGPDPTVDYVVDLYYYDDGAGSFEAPEGYAVDVSSATETADLSAADVIADGDGIVDRNPELLIAGFDFTCAAAPADAAGWTNNTCAPITVTYFTVAIGPGSDTDGDGELEYSPGCFVERYDVIVYPAAMTVVVTDDGTTCGTPNVELRNAAVGVILTGTACVADGDAFNYDFNSYSYRISWSSSRLRIAYTYRYNYLWRLYSSL
jgi:hypothetical protein